MSTMSNKAFDRVNLKLWVNSIKYWEDRAKTYFKLRHTFTLVPVDEATFWDGGKVEWRDGTPEEVYAFCRRIFNNSRRQVKIDHRRLRKSTAIYLKNYKGI